VSTIDPQVARAEKAQRERTSPGSYARAIVLSLVHAALWGAAGYGGGMLLDTFRLMAVNQVGAWGGLGDGFPWLFLIGVFGGAICGFALTGRMTVFLGPRAIGFPFFTAFIGLAIGLLLFLPRWTSPERIGFQKGFLEGDAATAWGPGSWVMYALPWWLPAVFGLIAMLALIGLVRGSARGRQKSDRIRSMIETGIRVLGTVSEVTSTGLIIMGNPQAQLTVRFTDASGTSRWVTKKHVFPPASIPRTGDAFTVWYDPLDPGNEKSIVLAPGDSKGTG
jgi:hypothetical protein